MATEKEYDEIVAPMLKDLADKCAALGMQMVARVEWVPGESGITASPSSIKDMKSGGMIVAAVACLSHGNVDRMCMTLRKQPGAENSIFLSRMDR